MEGFLVSRFLVNRASQVNQVSHWGDSHRGFLCPGNRGSILCR